MIVILLNVKYKCTENFGKAEDKQSLQKNTVEINNHSPTADNYTSLHAPNTQSPEGMHKATQVIKGALHKTAKWIWQNKGKIATGLLVLAKLGIDASTTSSGSDTKNSNNDISQPTQDISNEYSGNDEEKDNDIEKGDSRVSS